MLKLPQMGNARSWEAALSDPRAVGDLRDALLFFRTFLGERWTGWEMGSPFANRFFVSFQEKVSEGVRLHRHVKDLSNAPHIDLLGRKGLGSKEWSEFTSAVMTLEFCSRYRLAGHEVEFIKNDHNKRPDARILLSDRWVVVEFKGMHPPDEQARWDALMDQIMNGLFRHDLTLDKFDFDFDAPAVDHGDAIVESLVELVPAGPGWRALPFDSGRARLAEGRSFPFPFAQKDALSRLLLKQKSWCKQLLGIHHPTLLVVRSDDMFSVSLRSQILPKAELAAASLGEALSTKPMIGGVLIYAEPVSPPLPAAGVINDGFRLVAGAAPTGFARVAALVPNPHARIPLVMAELDKLIGPAMPW